MLEPQVPEVPEIAPPPRSRRLSSSGRTNRSRASHQHQEDRRRRQHERAEKAFTQQIVYDEPEEEFGDIVAIGNASGHFMNDDYRRGHETLVTPPSPPQQHPGVPFDRAEPGANYISGVNRARGVNGRNGSMERLAERFVDQRTGGSPAHRHFPPMPAQPSPSIPRTMATPPMMMPMAGPPIPNLRRNHTFDEDLSSPRMPLTERIPLRRRTNDFVPEDPMEYPSPSSRSSRSQQSRRRDTDTAYSTSPKHDSANPASALAGLTGEGRGKDRVIEWRTYVEPERRGPVTAQG
ncbi:hypothetical protein Micbo1qcDRAFT_27497 [Microdochium bolleyi]|uniref:Uncharacterized protein n=1 Tax=Microdochium bolleyi TaxID=196109 RepID=A0A136JER1_9PEZI|nr:hypothetical protein Micbo1qcDRAFT_27497 [Microdochium bolleyi]